MCSGNDSGNFVVQKTLCCDSLCRQNISTLEIHCQLMLVFGDCVLRPHHVGKGWIEFKSGLASIIKITLFRLAVQEHVNTVKWWNWFWKTIKTQFMVYPLHWSDLWKLPDIVHVQLGYSSVCTLLVPRSMMEVQKKIDVCRCSFTFSVI